MDYLIVASLLILPFPKSEFKCVIRRSASAYRNHLNEKWVKFKNTPAVLIVPRADASKFKSLTFSSWGYVYSKANKTKRTSIPKNESHIKSYRVLTFEWHERSNCSPYYSSDLFWKCSQNLLFYLPQFVCVVEMIDLPWSVVSLGEAKYQSAFLALNFT